MVRITRAVREDIAAWSRLQAGLWEATPEDIQTRFAKRDDEYLVLLAWTGDDKAVGFAEAALRRDYVNGCEGSPVVFLEGLYVEPPYRRQSVARDLVAAVEAWAKTLGIGELASDALLENKASHRMHAALGFEETERVIYFRKALT